MAIPGSDPYGSGGHLLIEAYWKLDDIETTSEIKGKEKYARILGFEFGLASPVDTHSGQSTGRRLHRPVTVRKLLDQSTPLIIDAIARNKMFPKSEIIVCGINAKDARKVDKFKVSMSDIRFIEATTIGGQDGASIVETVKIVYSTIEYEDIISKKMAMDNWREV